MYVAQHFGLLLDNNLNVAKLFRNVAKNISQSFNNISQNWNSYNHICCLIFKSKFKILEKVSTIFNVVSKCLNVANLSLSQFYFFNQYLATKKSEIPKKLQFFPWSKNNSPCCSVISQCCETFLHIAKHLKMLRNILQCCETFLGKIILKINI